MALNDLDNDHLSVLPWQFDNAPCYGVDQVDDVFYKT